MAGFNPLKEKIHTFEEATKILRWDSDSLLRKANEGKITPLSVSGMGREYKYVLCLF